MLLVILPRGAFVHSHVPLIFPVCLSCLKVKAATRTFAGHLTASVLLLLVADSQSLQVLSSEDWRGAQTAGSFRSTDLVTKAVQTRRAASQQSAPGAEVLKGIGYCLGLVREEFVAKGFAVGASQAWTMKVFAQLTVHVLLLIMHHQTLIMWTSKYA